MLRKNIQIINAVKYKTVTQLHLRSHINESYIFNVSDLSFKICDKQRIGRDINIILIQFTLPIKCMAEF